SGRAGAPPAGAHSGGDGGRLARRRCGGIRAQRQLPPRLRVLFAVPGELPAVALPELPAMTRPQTTRQGAIGVRGRLLAGFALAFFAVAAVGSIAVVQLRAVQGFVADLADDLIPEFA